MLSRYLGSVLLVLALVCVGLMVWNVNSTKELRVNLERAMTEKPKLDGQVIRVRRSLPNDAFVEYEAARRVGESFESWNERLTEARKLAAKEALSIAEGR